MWTKTCYTTPNFPSAVGTFHKQTLFFRAQTKHPPQFREHLTEPLAIQEMRAIIQYCSVFWCISFYQHGITWSLDKLFYILMWASLIWRKQQNPLGNISGVIYWLDWVILSPGCWIYIEVIFMVVSLGWHSDTKRWFREKIIKHLVQFCRSVFTSRFQQKLFPIFPEVFLILVTTFL